MKQYIRSTHVYHDVTTTGAMYVPARLPETITWTSESFFIYDAVGFVVASCRCSLYAWNFRRKKSKDECMMPAWGNTRKRFKELPRKSARAPISKYFTVCVNLYLQYIIYHACTMQERRKWREEVGTVWLSFMNEYVTITVHNISA